MPNELVRTMSGVTVQIVLVLLLALCLFKRFVRYDVLMRTAIALLSFSGALIAYWRLIETGSQLAYYLVPVDLSLCVLALMQMCFRGAYKEYDV